MCLRARGEGLLGVGWGVTCLLPDSAPWVEGVLRTCACTHKAPRLSWDGLHRRVPIAVRLAGPWLFLS